MVEFFSFYKQLGLLYIHSKEVEGRSGSFHIGFQLSYSCENDLCMRMRSIAYGQRSIAHLFSFRHLLLME
jgi:hypothetical protein